MKRSSGILKFLVVLGLLTFGWVADMSAQGSVIIRRPVRPGPPISYPYPTLITNCTPAPAGLVGWWKGDGNTLDSVSGNNGAAQNITYTGGMAGQAFACDPENQPYGTYTGIQVADQPVYALTNALSIEGWIRPRGDGYCIFYRGDNRIGLDPYVLSMQGNHELRFDVADESYHVASVATNLDYNVWYHVAATWDGATGVMKLYVNGQLASQTTTTVRPFGSLIPGDSPGVGIGNVNDGFNNFPFVGDIDEISLYNRALSADEIASIYNAGSAGKCPLAGHGFLMDIDIQGVYGVTSNASVKVGFAAIGQTTNDYWNFYTRDDPNASGGVRSSGAVSNLLQVDKTPTPVGMTVDNSPGAWSSESTDPMYVGYIYPFVGIMTITVTNLPDGQYEVLPYSRDGSFEANVGGVSYGIRQSEDPSAVGVPVWTEGVQYVRFSNVQITGGQPLVLTVQPGIGGYATISGLQIESSTVTNVPDCVTAPSNLVGWWPAEGNGNDSAGTNNATVPVGVTYAPGEVGQGFNLDGQDHRIIVPDAPELNFGPNQDFSIEVWIQPLANPGNWQDVMSIVDKRIAPDTITQLGYELNLQGGVLTFQMADVLAPFSWNNFSGGPDLRDGQFHHVAVTVQRNSTSGGRLYIDGQVVLTFDPTVCPGDLSNPGPLRIGNHATLYLSAFYHGLIDELSLYHRALSSNEVVSIYNAGSAGKCAGALPPEITVQPVNQTTVQGSNVVLSVVVDGTGPFSYQWSFNGTNIAGATNATLTLTNLHPYQSGSYTVTITTPYGTITSSDAIVTVIAQNILIYKYSGIGKFTTAGQGFTFAYSGQMFFIPDRTNGTFVGWGTIKGKKQYWVNDLSEYLLITIPGPVHRTITILGQAGQGIDTNGCPHIWSFLHKGQNTRLTVARNKYFSFPDNFFCDATQVYPDLQTGNLVLNESSSFYAFLPQLTQTANNTGQNLTDLVNALTRSLASQGYQKQ
ncbi:MAG: LamG-like jellyroll fold domain-containing protein [Verrucomicrobiia bacterium]